MFASLHLELSFQGKEECSLFYGTSKSRCEWKVGTALILEIKIAVALFGFWAQKLKISSIKECVCMCMFISICSALLKLHKTQFVSSCVRFLVDRLPFAEYKKKMKHKQNTSKQMTTEYSAFLLVIKIIFLQEWRTNMVK